MKKWFFVVAIVLISFSSGVVARAQDNGQRSRFMREAKFSAEFQKYFGGRPLQEFFSWQSRIGGDMALFESEKNAVWFKLNFQVVGGHPTDWKINTSGNSFTIEGRYERKIKSFGVGLGLTHVSTHLTKDVSKRVEALLVNQKNLPRDELEQLIRFRDFELNDINLAFVSIEKQIKLGPFRPTALIRIQPVDLSFRGNFSYYKMPFSLATETSLWQRNQKRILLETHSEFGKKELVADFALRLDLAPQEQGEGRIQILLGYSPGKNAYTTSDGLYSEGPFATVRFVFDSD